ncbi:MAG: RtcB family protein, partial [Chthoniobacterales bacterium]
GSALGQDYIAAMHLAGEYAYAGRDVVVAKVLAILGASCTYEVHNHHNFAWREQHMGTDVWVIRKGCTPAFPGQEGFVGATMGEPSVILRGAQARSTSRPSRRSSPVAASSCAAARPTRRPRPTSAWMPCWPRTATRSRSSTG